jgi:soluble lytic murein transglycosylase
MYIRLAWLILTIVVLLSPTSALAQDNTSLDEADRALFNGDYTAARELYSSELSNPTYGCRALFGLGVTYLRGRFYYSAAAQFDRYLQDCESTYQAQLLQADALRSAGRYRAALSQYESALTTAPTAIHSYIYERMAGIAGDQGLAYLRLAALSGRESVGLLDLQKRLLQVYVALGDTGNVTRQYRAMLNVATLSDDVSHIEYELAMIELGQGDAESAYPRLQRVITEFPQTEDAFSALVELVSAGQPVDWLARTRINISVENYQPIVDRLTPYLEQTPTDRVSPELYLLLGIAHRELGNIDEALSTFQQLRERYPNDPFASIAALEQIETRTANGDAPTADTYLELVESYPSSPEAAIALRNAAELLVQAGNWDDALLLYDRLIVGFPNSEVAQQGLFDAAMSLLASDPARAAEFFGKLGTAEGYFWQGKVLRQMNDVEGSRSAWHRAWKLEVGSLFSLRARDILLREEPYSASGKLIFPESTSIEREEAEQWLRATFALSTVSVDLPPSIAEDVRLERGTLLWELGWWGEAKAEFDALHRDVREDPATLYALAHYYKELGVFRSSTIAATRLLILSEQPHQTVPAYLARLAYPTPYLDLITEYAAEKQLDPLYVLALIRTETTFDPYALSVADAGGLMQMIPSTGQEVAVQLQEAKFSFQDLLRPDVSIRFGTHYLRTLLDAFENNRALALIGYNAGPGYAYAISNGDNKVDIDSVYQNIGIEETRNYIEFTYQSYTMYNLLYTEKPPF